MTDKVPNVGNAIDGGNVYTDNDTGEIIIEFVDIGEDEEVETQVLSSGIIYRAGIE